MVTMKRRALIHSEYPIRWPREGVAASDTKGFINEEQQTGITPASSTSFENKA